MQHNRADKWIYWLEEVNKEHGNLVGKKCANLGELTRAGFRVPQGFALSLDAYDMFLYGSGVINDIDRCLSGFKGNPYDPRDMLRFGDLSKEIRSVVESRAMPADVEEIIGQHYDDLCRKTRVDNVPVATRSAGPVSHPGQYETYLCVKGRVAVMQNIIKVWSSTFNAPSLLARARAGLPLNHDPIGVAVLQMVHAKAAGVMFTLNPSNGDKSKIIIEGNWGLGETVVSGSVTPDEWTVDKVVLEITSRTISSKGIENVVDPDSRTVVALEIPHVRQNAPCLADEEIVELARVSKQIERHYGCAQDIEWVIASDLPFPQNVFFVQTRPETIWSKQKIEPKLRSAGNSAADVIQFYQNLKA